MNTIEKTPVEELPALRQKAREVAIAAARKAGVALLARLHGDKGTRYKGDLDMVTLADTEAERIIIELRDRAKALASEGGAEFLPGAAAAPVGAQAEAFSALVALGYKPPEVTRLLKTVATEGATTEDLIRKALQQVAGK